MSLFKLLRREQSQRSGSRFFKFKRDHTQSFASTGERCKCGHDHSSINILDDNGKVIECDVCPFMYNVRNACLRAKFGKHIPKVDSALLQEISKL